MACHITLRIWLSTELAAVEVCPISAMLENPRQPRRNEQGIGSADVQAEASVTYSRISLKADLSALSETPSVQQQLCRRNRALRKFVRQSPCGCAGLNQIFSATPSCAARRC